MACRFLYVVGQLRSGGLERQLYYLLKAMDRGRYLPAVAVWSPGKEDVYVKPLAELGVPVIPLCRSSSRTAKLNQFRHLVRTIGPEVVHSYGFYTNFAAYWGVLGSEVVAVGAVRSDFHRAREVAGPLLGRLSGRWPRAQICNSNAAAIAAKSAQGPFVPRQLFVIRNGLDLDAFPQTPPPDDGPIGIVGVGSLFAIKRWDRLLTAAAHLKNRGHDCVIRIAGDGPLREALEKQAQKLEVSDRVQFMGYVSDIAGLLSRSAFLVHTSDTEGCPNVVMEAMACGKPVIATSVGDTPYLVDDGVTGFLVHPGNDAELVGRMELLIRDRELSRRLGQAGRAKAEVEFRLDRLVQETLQAYRDAGWRPS